MSESHKSPLLPEKTAQLKSATILKWTGKLNVSELKNAKTESAPLFAALFNRCYQLGHSINEMCDALGFSYPYFSQLRSGRRTLKVDMSFTKSCANYLGVPRLTVLALARLITLEDLLEEPDELVVALPRAIEYISQDDKWGYLITESVRCTSIESQYLIVRLYEQHSGVALLPKEIDPIRLAESIQELERITQQGFTTN